VRGRRKEKRRPFNPCKPYCFSGVFLASLERGEGGRKKEDLSRADVGDLRSLNSEEGKGEGEGGRKRGQNKASGWCRLLPPILTRNKEKRRKKGIGRARRTAPSHNSANVIFSHSSNEKKEKKRERGKKKEGNVVMAGNRQPVSCRPRVFASVLSRGEKKKKKEEGGREGKR